MSNALAPLLDGLLHQAAPLLRTVDDPGAELLALVWGPRFDRLHARQLVGRVPPPVACALWPVLQQAADVFEVLPCTHQHRLRRLILVHGARWENLRHATRPAD